MRRMGREALKMETFTDDLRINLTRVFAWRDTPGQTMRATADVTSSLPMAVSKEILYRDHEEVLR